MLRTLGDRYQPTEYLGGGETGEVWHAIDRVTGRPVAVKVLHQRLAADTRLAERLLRSRGALTALWHPSVARLLDIVMDDDVVALVTELVDGTDLRELLATRGAMAPTQAAEVAATVADALDAAHRTGVVHGDVKPANVLVPPPYGGPIRLTDFAVAMLTHVGRRTDPAGTAPYRAPEVADGAMPTASSDVYSLGVLLRELDPDTPALLAIAELCTTPNQALRPSAAEVSERLWKVIPELAPRGIESERGAPATRGRRRPLAAVGIALALVVTGVVVVAWAMRAPPAEPGADAAPGTTGTAGGPPVLPADATARTEQGANAFVGHWFAILTYAEQTGDTGPLAGITATNCGQCQTAMETIRAAFADGGSLRGGVYVVRAVAVNRLLDLERPVYEATLDRSARSSVDRSGVLRSTLPELSFAICMLVLEWADDAWRVFEVTSQDCVA